MTAITLEGPVIQSLDKFVVVVTATNKQARTINDSNK